MATLEAELAAARDLDVTELADAIESIGFECTRCGACCTGSGDDPHTATVFPDEVRALAGDDAGWRDVARPMPFGLDADGTGETFEWALQTDGCGDCTFYADGAADDPGTCTAYPDRPLICETYPFSVDLAGATPMGAVVDAEGLVLAHECEGLGRDIARSEAVALGRALKRRAVRELEEAVAVRDRYRPVDDEPVVVHDSEGAKRPDGSAVDRWPPGRRRRTGPPADDRTMVHPGSSLPDMELPDQLRCLFNAEVRATGAGYVVEVPETEVDRGTVEAGEVYRVALLTRGATEGPSRSRERPPSRPQPPVERGEIRYVEVEDLGKQGDGIARVERGYVIIVPGGEVGDRVKVEVTEVKSNFAVGEIVEETFE